MLLWELYTNANTPYPAVTNGRVFRHVSKGHTLDVPNGCPDTLCVITLAFIL